MRSSSGVALATAAFVGLSIAVIAHAAPPAPAPAPIPPAKPGAGSVVPAVAGLPPMQATVKITIVTLPSSVRKTFVSWGKKKLGVIEPRRPLIIERPRDSGPLDLIVTSDGYVPVQTRAFTFSDTKLTVKLTPIDQKNTLLGYREELPPAAPDAGAPASTSPGVSGGLPPTIAAPPAAPPVAQPGQPQPSWPGRDAGAR
jgi:hypothetical protein